MMELKGEKNMNQKIKMTLVLMAIGFIGFLPGVTARTVYSETLPFLLEKLPQIFSSELTIWGLIGALLAIICSLIYAYLS